MLKAKQHTHSRKFANRSARHRVRRWATQPCSVGCCNAGVVLRGRARPRSPTRPRYTNTLSQRPVAKVPPSKITSISRDHGPGAGERQWSTGDPCLAQHCLKEIKVIQHACNEATTPSTYPLGKPASLRARARVCLCVIMPPPPHPTPPTTHTHHTWAHGPHTKTLTHSVN